MARIARREGYRKIHERDEGSFGPEPERDAVIAHGDASMPRETSGGSMPRTTSGGSTPRTKSHGNMPCTTCKAAMACISTGTTNREGSTLCIACEAGMSRSKNSSPLGTPNDESSTHRPASSQSKKEDSMPRTTGDPSKFGSRTPNKTATDEEYALAARKSRLRFEDSLIVTSAAELVRERVLKPDAVPDTITRQHPSNAARRGLARNTQRLTTANASDVAILGESTQPVGRNRSSFGCHLFLPNDPRLFFPETIVGPDDSFEPPGLFLKAIRTICSHASKTPSRPPIVFELGEQAAAHNAEVLRGFGYDLGAMIRAHSSSTLGFGSEFRSVTELQPLLGRHPHFGKLADLLTNGMDYVFTRELSEPERKKEVEAMLKRGNHKSAQEEQEQVAKLIAKDVLHGFTIPIPIGTVRSIPGVMVQPLGLVQQWTVAPGGERVIKFRLTQDLSFTADKDSAPMSINSRVDMSAYPEMIYGWCLPRIMHYIVSLRFHRPTSLIFISKYDYSDAYRRIAHSAAAATQTVSVNGDTAFLSLRLTFGGSPNPPTWCMFSERVTDLANEISQCTDWDPTEIRSPSQPDTPEPIRLPAAIPLAQSRLLAVLAPMSESGGKVDGFIDDLINVFVDTPENCARQPHVVPLAMHVTSRPHAGEDSEPVPRRPILSIPKLIAEGRPEEVQTVLGWTLDTRRLEISLPLDKYTAWSTDIKRVRAEGSCSHKELETLVGRLNHAAYVLPTARHFLSRIRGGLRIPGGKRTNPRRPRFGTEALEDLLLWEAFLADAHAGVSINLLVTRRPDKVCWSDACPYGIGGYSISGRAWRIQIPKSSPIFGHKGINNLLEFVGMAINIWLSCDEAGSAGSCILAIGDNTSAIGWLHNTSRLDPTWEAHDTHLRVARKIASLLMRNKCCLASQHVKGELNVVADLLSFSGSDRGKKHPLAFDHPANDELTARFLSALPSQVPESFVISQLPEEILSWTTRVLQAAELSLMGDKRGATRPTTGHGGGGRDTATTWGTETTPTSLCYPSLSKNSSSARSSTSIELPSGTPLADLPELVKNQWLQALCAKPQATWLRRFGGIWGKAPCTSRVLPTCAHS